MYSFPACLLPKTIGGHSYEKSTLKSRVPLIAVAVVMMMALTLTAAAAVVVHLFRNDIIVSSRDDIPMPSSENGAPGAVAIDGPGGTRPPLWKKR